MRSHDTVEKERLHSSFPFRFTSAPSAGHLLPICLHRPPLSLSWKLLLNSASSVEASSSNAGVSLVLGSPRQAVGSSSDLSRQERHDRAPSAHHGRPGTEKQVCSFVLRGLPPFPLLFLAGPNPRVYVHLHSGRVSLLSQALEMPSQIFLEACPNFLGHTKSRLADGEH